MTPRRATVAIVACVMTSGCGLLFNREPLPPREMFRLRLVDSASVPVVAVNAGTFPIDGSLAIAPYETPGLYGERGIVFRVGQTSYGAYPSREWAVPLSEMLGSLTESVLQRNPISREQAVYDPPSRRSRTYIWRGTVREFEEVNMGSAVSVAVRLDVKLVRSTDDSLIWSGSERIERSVSQPTMPNIVSTLSDAAIEVITRLSRTAVHDMSAASSAAQARP
jgi:ABC-type uncharacterized transport system auxiliary subunit